MEYFQQIHLFIIMILAYWGYHKSRQFPLLQYSSQEQAQQNSEEEVENQQQSNQSFESSSQIEIEQSICLKVQGFYMENCIGEIEQSQIEDENQEESQYSLIVSQQEGQNQENESKASSIPKKKKIIRKSLKPLKRQNTTDQPEIITPILQ